MPVRQRVSVCRCDCVCSHSSGSSRSSTQASKATGTASSACASRFRATCSWPLLPTENPLSCLPGLPNRSTPGPAPAPLITVPTPSDYSVLGNMPGCFLHICHSASPGPGEVIWWLLSLPTQYTLPWAPTIAEGQWWSLGPPSDVIHLTSVWPSGAFGAQLA